jgi:probable HAF family extracellular repeat protein
MEDLGDLSGFPSYQDLRAWDINDAGWIVGTATDHSYGGGQRAFLWTPQDGMRDLGTLGGKSALAVAINRHGQVVGCADVPSEVKHAYLWSAATGMRDLGTLGGQYSSATAINDAGHVGGYSSVPDGPPVHAFLWSEERGMTDLRKPLTPYCYVVALSDAGHVVARGSVLEWGHDVARYRPEAWPVVEWASDWGRYAGVPGIVLRSLAGEPASGSAVKAVAVNAAGDVVGQALTAGGEYRACLWPARSEPIDLGALPGGTMSYALGLNGRGDIVGWSTDVSRKMRAVLWRTA